MREDKINSILRELNGGSIEASALITTNGLIIASALTPGMNENRVSARVATLLPMGERMAAELFQGGMEHLMLSKSDGHVLVTRAGPDAILCTIAKKDANLGALIIDASGAAQAAAELLQ